ncbi:hypothetical protein [Vampirovibrio chlorellavorus]|uniref:hypothetical protein n=1 Tax=Vampirovibrio chlorellavorus TaxID=758823 RepID=UPI0026ED56FB|nr:hypothetical protein [Vampirovibrio chlorellavorus]
MQPLLGLMVSLLTGESAAGGSSSGSSGSSSSGSRQSDNTLGPDSDASDYLDVLSENDSELKALEKKFGDRDGKLSEKELKKILRKIEKGDTKGIEVSADLQAALTWLAKDEQGQSVFTNLANEVGKDERAAVDIRKGFDESAWDDVDGDITEESGPYDAEEAVQYLVDNKKFAEKVAGADGQMTKEEINQALASNDYSLEEKAQLRFLREHYEDITDALYVQYDQPISLKDLADKLKPDTEVDGQNVLDELQNIEAKKK